MKLKIILLLGLLILVHPVIISQITIEGEFRNTPVKLSKRIPFDQAFMECIYEYNDEDGVTAYYDILQIGDNLSKYSSYSAYKVDSVVFLKDISKMTTGDFFNIYNKYGFNLKKKFDHEILKNYPESKLITVYDKVFIDRYEYEDSVSIDWSLKDDTASVCGYLCRKAEANFRGMHWIAYYTEDIPISDGPWKLSGLPGLILKAEDSDGKHFFTAVVIRKSEDTIYVNDYDSFKTNRKRFNKQLKAYKSDPSGVIAGSVAAPIDPKTGKPSKLPPQKYDPLELE